MQRGTPVYVAEVGELTKQDQCVNGRLPCIYENGTENDLLLQSLARNLYEDGRIVTEPADVTASVFETPTHIKTGYVYVAQSLSTDPKLEQFKDLHKIGYTTQSVQSRLSGAENDPTFLRSKAHLVDAYEMPADYDKMIETLLHQFFSEVRLDVWHGTGESANEWSDVPAEAIDLIQSGQLANFRYDPISGGIRLSAEQQ